MLRDQIEVDALVATAREMGLLDHDLRVTRFGRDIVHRSRGSHLTASANNAAAATSGAFYLPTQFQNGLCGVQRKTRNEPGSNP